MRETTEQRLKRGRVALELYQRPMSVRDVAARLEVSYGKAYALIKEAGGSQVFRPRGTRARVTQIDDEE